jgi:hypothetical protein
MFSKPTPPPLKVEEHEEASDRLPKRFLEGTETFPVTVESDADSLSARGSTVDRSGGDGSR